MLSFLRPADAPVIESLEEHEVVYAKDQKDYTPLRTLKSTDKTCKVLSRWALTPSQREAVAGGADIYLELCTFGNHLQPIRMAIGKDVRPEYIQMEYGLPVHTTKTM